MLSFFRIVILVLVSVSAGYSFSLPDSLSKDTLIRFEAQSKDGFNYPYYLFVPAKTRFDKVHHLLVETNNAGLNDSLEYHEREAKIAAGKRSLGNYVSRKLRTPYIVPAFPRLATDWVVYTHALDRDAMHIKGDQKRLDLQLIAMIRHARKELEKLNLKTKDKVLFNGFSASGTFANRFTMLHPELVAAVACGGINAFPILPVSTYENIELDYPLGTHDLEKIKGAKADMQVYKQVPQFLYMGAKDDNDAVLFDDAYSNEEREKIYRVFGKNMMPDRWEKCKKIYSEAGINARFQTFDHIGHGTDGKVHAELIEFFEEVLGTRY